MASKKANKKDYFYAVGRRRTSSARVRLYKGKNESTVNGELIGKYFPGAIMRTAWQRPLKLTDLLDKYYVTIKVVGGGKKGQLDACVHGISKALAQMDREKLRPILKAEGLLTRDARKRERRMVGTGGKARRKKQSPKR
jgi:small subunit ribosomal protein S9